MASGSVNKDLDTDHLALVLEARIAKSDRAQRRIWGFASVAVKKDGTPLVDLQGDVIEIEDLAEGWYGYVKESGKLNFVHKDDCDAALIEAVVFTPEKLEVWGLAPDALPLAAWVGYEFATEEEFDHCLESGYFMFSIQGLSNREPF